MGASDTSATALGAATERLELHHHVPQCLLTLRDKADAASLTLDGAGIEAWLEYEHEAMRYGVDPDVSRDELAALIDASTVVLGREAHRSAHVNDFVRWGSRGGRATLERYGRAWFSLLALRRWGRIAPAELELARARG
jgi:hypothetical protein